MISDIDDTVKHTEVCFTNSMLRNTFVREFDLVEGMGALYRRWKDQVRVPGLCGDACGIPTHNTKPHSWHLHRCSPLLMAMLRSFRVPLFTMYRRRRGSCSRTFKLHSKMAASLVGHTTSRYHTCMSAKLKCVTLRPQVVSCAWRNAKVFSFFFTPSCLPPEPPTPQDFDIRSRKILSLLAPASRSKPQKISSILRCFPKRKFVLVGDSGEQDPEIYAAVIREHPEQVSHVYIRRVAGDGRKDVRARPCWARRGAVGGCWQDVKADLAVNYACFDYPQTRTP